MKSSPRLLAALAFIGALTPTFTLPRAKAPVKGSPGVLKRRIKRKAKRNARKLNRK